MKKMLSVFCVALITLLLCGCNGSADLSLRDAADFSAINFDTQNYNNLYDTYEEFHYCNGTYFYTSYYDTFDSCIYTYHGDKKIPVISDTELSDEFFYDDYFIIGNDLYFYTCSEDYEDTSCNFYKYNLADKKYSKICTIKDVGTFMVLDNCLVYDKYYDDADGISPLYYYDMNTKKEVLICNEIEAFGIVNDKIRYIAFSGEYNIYEYDLSKKASSVLGSFSGYSIKEYVTYNFTDDRIIMLPATANSHNNSTQFSVYYLKDNSYNTYTLPEISTQFITGKDYAFMLSYVQDKTESSNSLIFDNQKYNVYKIDLSDGSYKNLNIDADYLTSIYVVSDNEIHTLQGNSSLFSPYTTEVTKYDLKNKTAKRQFKY